MQVIASYLLPHDVDELDWHITNNARILKVCPCLCQQILLNYIDGHTAVFPLSSVTLQRCIWSVWYSSVCCSCLNADQFLHTLQHDPMKHFAWYRKECDPSVVCTVAEVDLFCYLDRKVRSECLHQGVKVGMWFPGPAAFPDFFFVLFITTSVFSHSSHPLAFHWSFLAAVSPPYHTALDFSPKHELTIKLIKIINRVWRDKSAEVMSQSSMYCVAETKVRMLTSWSLPVMSHCNTLNL